MKNRIISLVWLMLLTANLFAGQVFYVTTSGSDSNDGKSWATAFADVQKAIDAAHEVATDGSPSEVWIAVGTYKHGSAMTMKNNVEIYGGFAGTETSKEERTSGNETILDGEGKYRIFYNNYIDVEPLTNSSKLDSITIQNGYRYEHSGAGMYNYYSSPEITNCIFTHNIVQKANGGGIYNCNSSPIVKDCIFSENIANTNSSDNGIRYGGGMYNEDFSNPIITNCTFLKNEAGALGGGICNRNSSNPILMNCTFLENNSSNGGGIYNFTSNPVLTNCNFSKNVSSLSGGGVYNSSSSPKFTNCEFSDNMVLGKAGNFFCGGGIYNVLSDPIFKNCVFRGNKVYSSSNNRFEKFYSNGGGIYNSSSNPILINCTFSENIASFDAYSFSEVYSSGGGMYNTSSMPTLINCTFRRNEASFSSLSPNSSFSRGGGIYNAIASNSGVTPSKVTLTNCIFWDNIPDELYNSVYYSYYFIIDSCIIKGGFNSSTNIITEDPLLGELGYYGGKVQTMPVLAGSPAIGAGIVDENTPKTDARGLLRSTTAPTIGAYEWVAPKILNISNDIFAIINQSVQISVELENYTGEVAYQWQILDGNEEWVDIENATSSNYTISNCQIEMTGNKYRCIVSNIADGASSTSEEIVLTVNYPPFSQAELSANHITIVDGGYGRLEVSSDAFQPTYKWYYSADTGLTWVEIENSNSSVLEFPVSKSMNRYQYKCIVTDGGGTSVESDKAVLIVNSTAITISQDIADTTAFIGKETLLSVSANSSSTLGYQWQVSTDNGATWVDIKDARSSSLSLTPEDYELSGNLYRLKIDNGGGFIYSSNSKITVFKNVEITSQPLDLIVWNTKNAEFEVSATGDGTVKYQWQALVGEEWQDIENATSPNLFLENVSTEMNGNKYRCIVSNEGTATLYSNEATLTVYKTLEIITQPKETYTFEGDSTTFSVAVDAQGDVTYQWQELIADVWTNIENETSSIFTITTMETSFEGRKFRAVITNGGDEFISDVAELKLATPIEITKQPTIIDVAYVGKTAVFSVEVNGYRPEYQWYVSGNYGTEVGVEIAGATGNTLSILVENDSILENVYFCKITNAKATLTTDLVYVNEVRTLSAFQEWSMANGLGVDALSTATPHNDGITNLEKYAFGLDASKATSYGANGNFKHSVEGGVASFQFPVRKDASDISVKLMMSNDMSNWEEADAVSIGESGEFNLFNYSAPVPVNGKVFFKLKVLEK